MNPGIQHGLLDGDLGAAESRIGPGLVTGFEGEDVIVMQPRTVGSLGLASEIVADHGRIVVHGPAGVDQHR